MPTWLQLAAVTPAGQAKTFCEIVTVELFVTAMMVLPCGMRVPLTVRPMSLFCEAPLLQPLNPALQKCALLDVIVFVPKLVAMTVRPSELLTVSFAPLATPGEPTTLLSVTCVADVTVLMKVLLGM